VVGQLSLTKTKPKIVLARQFRKNLTPPELLLWSRLKYRDDTGLVFRRQHPFGPYILDFYCARAGLAIEVDGIDHSLGDRPEKDQKRETYLTERGLEIYRLPAAVVFKDPDGAADGVRLKAYALWQSKGH
jgi:very-short-patch-repair endonuclease